MDDTFKNNSHKFQQVANNFSCIVKIINFLFDIPAFSFGYSIDKSIKDALKKNSDCCTNVANKIARSNSMINRVKNLLPPPTLKILYHSFIQPHVLYGLPAWGGCSAQNKKRIINI